MRLVIGLRNPGPDYEGTRHNIGGDVVARVAAGHSAMLKRAKRTIRADWADIHIGAARAVIAIPRTFMNESGHAVAAVACYHGVDPDDLLVVHDDIDLPFAKLRVSVGSGPGGHNGVRSVIRALGSESFWRLKLGVGRPPSTIDPADFVLRRFSKVEQPQIEDAIVGAAAIVERFVIDGGEVARQAAGESNAG